MGNEMSSSFSLKLMSSRQSVLRTIQIILDNFGVHSLGPWRISTKTQITSPVFEAAAVPGPVVCPSQAMA
jgi:hypothetical protein